jgi:hypothetical protein
MKTTTGRWAAIAVTSVALVAASAGVAAASGQESGYQSCAGLGSQEVVSRGYTTGIATHTQNGVSHTFPSTPTLAVTNYNRLLRTANWTVKTTGSLNASGTYGYCPS